VYAKKSSEPGGRARAATRSAAVTRSDDGTGDLGALGLQPSTVGQEGRQARGLA